MPINNLSGHKFFTQSDVKRVMKPAGVHRDKPFFAVKFFVIKKNTQVKLGGEYCHSLTDNLTTLFTLDNINKRFFTNTFLKNP